MYGMTTVAPSINFTVDGFGFLLVFCWGFPHWRTVLASGCLVGLFEGDSFLFKEFRCRTYMFSSVEESMDKIVLLK